MLHLHWKESENYVHQLYLEMLKMCGFVVNSEIDLIAIYFNISSELNIFFSLTIVRQLTKESKRAIISLIFRWLIISLLCCAQSTFQWRWSKDSFFEGFISFFFCCCFFNIWNWLIILIYTKYHFILFSLSPLLHLIFSLLRYVLVFIKNFKPRDNFFFWMSTDFKIRVLFFWHFVHFVVFISCWVSWLKHFSTIKLKKSSFFT